MRADKQEKTRAIKRERESAHERARERERESESESEGEREREKESVKERPAEFSSWDDRHGVPGITPHRHLQYLCEHDSLVCAMTHLYAT